MTRVKKLTLAALAALALAAGAAAYVPAQQQAGDPSQWGVAKKGSFDITELDDSAGVAWSWGETQTGSAARKVNEYEGQHRVAKVNEYEGQHRVAKANVQDLSLT